jgi:hypothetical protein
MPLATTQWHNKHAYSLYINVRNQCEMEAKKKASVTSQLFYWPTPSPEFNDIHGDKGRTHTVYFSTECVSTPKILCFLVGYLTTLSE